MTKHILAAVAAMLISSAFGYGWQDAVGAWAFESSPDKPCIVVTNNTVWLLEDGVWKPGTTGSPREYGTCFSLSVDKEKRDYAIWKPYDKWEFAALKKSGCSVTNGDWLFSDSKKGTAKYEGSRKVVKAMMPDWNAIRNDKAYFGFWKPVRYGKRSKVMTGPEVGNRMLLKIREDNNAVLYFKEFKPTTDMKEPYAVLTLVPAEGQFRVFRQGRRSEAPDLDRGMYEALWLQPDGCLRKYGQSRNEVIVFEKTDEAFDDPLDRRMAAAAKKSIHGVWGVSVEFEIFILAFDKGGKGYASFFMGPIPFSWTMDGEGVIHCTPDTKGMFPKGSRSGEEFRIECTYDAVRNEMLADLIIIRDGKEERSERKVLPFMREDGNVPELMKRFEAARRQTPRQH